MDKDTTVTMRDLSNADLIEMHLSYRPGGNHHVDEEVWRRWPTLAKRMNQMQFMQQRATEERHAAGPVDLDELPPETPGYAEAMAAYEQEARKLAADSK
jgi:hypothetical protein